MKFEDFVDTPTSCHRFAAKCKRCVKDLFNQHADGQHEGKGDRVSSAYRNLDGKCGEMLIFTLEQLADRERIERSQLDA